MSTPTKEAEIEGEEIEIEDVDAEVEETETEQPANESETDQDAENDAGEEENGDGSEDGEEEDDIVIEGETPTPEDEKDEFAGKPAPPWAKDLRKKNRELERELAAIKREKEDQAKAKEEAKAKIELGKKPTLWDDEINGDEDAFERKLLEFNEKKKLIDKQRAEEQSAKDAADAEWQNTRKAYEERKKTLKVRDYDEAEDNVKGKLSITQQGIILSGSKDPAVAIYALHRTPEALARLAAIKDPIKFAVALGELQTKMKSSPRKVTTSPERKLRGTAPSGGGRDPKLERLEAKAANTGDRSEVIKYKAQLERARSK